MLSTTISLMTTGSDLEKRRFVPWSRPCLSKNHPPCECQGAGPLPACSLNKHRGSCSSAASGTAVPCAALAPVHLGPSDSASLLLQTSSSWTWFTSYYPYKWGYLLSPRPPVLNKFKNLKAKMSFCHTASRNNCFLPFKGGKEPAKAPWVLK